MKAKKSFGQHFLINKSLSSAIVDLAIEKSAGLKILEVGPGQGALTSFLVAQGVEFIAVDADREMIAFLKDQFPDHEDRFYLEDFLKYNLQDTGEDEVLILGNFPYNISSQIVFKLVACHEQVPCIIGMFQKEVADRIVAPHGSKTYGVLSVLIQFYYDCKIVFKVSPGSFSPPPKVRSAVVHFERRTDTPDCNYKLLRTVTKLAFGQRRKMLRNTLKSIVQDPELLNEELFSKRPEQLSVDQFVQLTNIIEKLKSS